MAVDPQASTIIIMSRPLKEILEKYAYLLYTHSNQTDASPSLIEEMRWLALYPEVGWESTLDLFWKRFAMMTNHRGHAMNWVPPN